MRGGLGGPLSAIGCCPPRPVLNGGGLVKRGTLIFPQA